MLKVKVLKSFIDKHTGKKHKPGDVLDVTVTRCNELIEKDGFIKLLEETPAPISQDKKEIKNK
jgi:hypothetical protein